MNAAAPPAAPVAMAADPSGYVPHALWPRVAAFRLPLSLRGGGIVYPPVRLGAAFVALTQSQSPPPGGPDRPTGIAAFRASGRLLWRRALAASTAPAPLGREVAVVAQGARGPVLLAFGQDGVVRLRHPLAGVSAVDALVAASGPEALVALARTESSAPAAPCDLVGLARTGRTLWQSPKAVSCGQTPVVTDGLVLARSGDGLVALVASSGVVRWQVRVRSAFGLAASGGGVAVLRTSASGALWAVDLRRGRLLWRRRLPRLGPALVVTARSVLACRPGGPSCERLDLRTGRVVAMFHPPAGLAGPLTLWPLAGSDSVLLVAAVSYPRSGPHAYIWRVPLEPRGGRGTLESAPEAAQAAYTYRSQDGAFTLTPQGLAWRW